MKKRSLSELGRVDFAEFQKAKKTPVAFILDNVRSALNVGSAFRTADAFAIEKIWLCGITATPPNREILKTALGADESVDWEHAAETAFLLQKLEKEGWLLVAVEQTDSSILLQNFDWKTPFENRQKIGLVFGNEVDGVSDAALAECEMALEIPQIGTKHSLNISVALGIVAFEAMRNGRLS